MKSLLHYLRFNIDTLQGKITVGLWAVGLMGVFITLYPLQAYVKIQKRQDFVLRQVVQVMYHGSKLENSVGETSSSIQDFMLTNDPVFTQKCHQIWENQCKTGMDSLIASANLSQDAATNSLANDLSIRLQKLRNEQDAIIKFYEQKPSDSLLKIYRSDHLNRLRYQTDDIKTVLETIMNIQESTILRMNVQNDIDKQTSFSIFVTMAFCILFTSIIIGYYMVMSEVRKIKRIKTHLQEISIGNLPEAFSNQKDEYYSIRKAINTIIENFKKLDTFAHNFEKNNSTEDLIFQANSQMGQALSYMQNRIQERIVEDQQRVWESKGLDIFNKILREGRNSGKNIDQICDAFIAQMVSYLNVQQGNIYVVRSSDKNILRLSAFYAFGKRKENSLFIEKGEGLIGEVFRENQTHYIDDIPENYMRISSGLGSIKPNYLLVVPLRANDEVQGVIELASFNPFLDYHIEFLERIGEGIASTLVSIRNLERNQRLLKNAQQATEQLRSQEEEMRQNLEEFQATQEVIDKREKENQQLLNNLLEREKIAQTIAQENSLLKIRIEELEKKLK